MFQKCVAGGQSLPRYFPSIFEQWLILGGFGGFIFPIRVLTAGGKVIASAECWGESIRAARNTTSKVKKKDLAILRSDVSISVGA